MSREQAGTIGDSSGKELNGWSLEIAKTFCYLGGSIGVKVGKVYSITV